MSRYLTLSNRLEFIFKCILFISIPALTLFLLRTCEKRIMIVSFAASCIVSLIIVKFILKKIKKIDLLCCGISFLLSSYIMSFYYNYHLTKPFIGEYYSFSLFSLQIISFFATIATTTFIYLVLKKFVPIILNFFKSLTSIEKKFLIIFSIVSFVLTFIIYFFTSAFYYVEGINWDIIYTSDSSATYFYDTYFNLNSPLNDPAKQPLFGLFAFPFGVLAKILSQVFFFIPNCYAVFCTSIQLVIMAVTLIMLVRLIGVNDKNKILFFLFFLSTFGIISFAFILEQYIITLFYIVLVIYSFFYSKWKINYTYLGAVGTVITSGILFPFLSKTKNLKDWFINAFICFLVFVAIIIIFGQLPVVFLFVDSIMLQLNSFAGEGLSFSERLMQYLTFVKGIFFAIPADTMPTIAEGTPHLSYYIESVYHFSKTGILILLICLISAFLNRKNKMAIISLLWIVFSFIVLCIVGWGCTENGLNLYNLYFGWAFVILIYLFIDFVVKNDLIKKSVLILLCIGMLIVNVPEFVNIVVFGITNYPN